MEKITSIQELLKSNSKEDFKAHIKASVDLASTIQRKHVAHKKWKVYPISEEELSEFSHNAKELYESVEHYVRIALLLNPIIAKYNEAIKDNSLEDAKKYAIEILHCSRDNGGIDLTARVGMLRRKFKRSWLKVDAPLRNDLFKKVDAFKTMKADAKKMSVRKKSLDVKTVYPYWLW